MNGYFYELLPYLESSNKPISIYMSFVKINIKLIYLNTAKLLSG